MPFQTHKRFRPVPSRQRVTVFPRLRPHPHTAPDDARGGEARTLNARTLNAPTLEAPTFVARQIDRWFPDGAPRWTRWIPWRNGIDRPTRVGRAVAAVFTAIVGLPALTAWATHRTPPDQISRWLNSADAQTTVSVYRMNSGTVTRLPLNDYIVNVLAAELPPTAPMPALQAAAVASRTYVIYLMTHQGTGAETFAERHGADVTDDGLLDLPWLTEAQQQQVFGANDTTYTARLQQAVASTDGEVLTYQGQPIPAFLFELSPGRTRDASAVFGKSLPYLPVVNCPDDRAVPADRQTHTFTPADLAARLNLPAKGLNPAAIHIAARGKDGFVSTVTYNPGATSGTGSSAGTSASTKAWTGTDFANMLGLPSADFQLQVNGDTLTVHTQGVGTDIGMSLHEASVYAARGKRAAQILAVFYPGTQMTQDTPFVAGK